MSSAAAPSLKQSRAELELDSRFTEFEREVIAGLLTDPSKVTRYASNGATDTELAAIFGVPIAAFEPFSALLASSRAELNDRIRRAVLTAAEKGSPEALVYLTAKYLDRRTAKARKGRVKA